MQILIIGGSGTMSLHTARILLTSGHHVTVLNRGSGGPADCASIVADRHNAESLRVALMGRRFDVVIDMVCFTVDQASMLVEALPHCGHLIFCSTVCALGFAPRPMPVSEEAPCRPTFAYGRNKAACEQWYRSWSEKHGFPLTIVRPSTTFDGRVGIFRQLRSDTSAWLGRIRAGRPIVLADSGMAVHQFMHAYDAGRAFASMVGSPIAYGKTYHLVGDAVTWADHARAAMRALGCEVDLVGIPSAILDRSTIPDDGIRREIFGHHCHFEAVGLQRDFGYRPEIDLDATLARTIVDLDAAGRIPAHCAEDWEDALIARWG